MVVKMMKWSPWPPIPSRKFEARIFLGRIEDLGEMELQKSWVVEIKWKGQKGIGLSSLRRFVKRDFTKEGSYGDDEGFVAWDEEFRCSCNLSGSKDSLFSPWEVAFTVFNQGPRYKDSVFGTASINLADFASTAEQIRQEVTIPIRFAGEGIENNPLYHLCLSLCLVEINSDEELSEKVQGSNVRTTLSSPSVEGGLSRGKYEVSSLKAGLRKVRRFTNYMSGRRAWRVRHEEEGSDGRSSLRSEHTEYKNPFDTDLFDDYDASGKFEEEADSSVRQSLSYETLADANNAGGSLYSDSISNNEKADWIQYSNGQQNVGCLYDEDSTISVCNQSQQSSKRSIIPWRKRKLTFRSPKAEGEPLLKKFYEEEGGDDIDFDRRQLSSSDESNVAGCKTEEGSTASRSSMSEFGEDNFFVGCWEDKEVMSRDGRFKLQTRVFFASIDQRSEIAAGEGACTPLVAIIADWLLSNRYEIPIKSEFDRLIRDGSSEWRNLCEKKAYMEQFPDKHFDLETVLQAKIRPISVDPEKSFIGFFCPEEPEENGFDFLRSSMSFDKIWDEISLSGSEFQGDEFPLVYIVSWNDHFFVLMVEHDAYYIIDTLGERLFEGCNHAYVLKFDKDTTIQHILNDNHARNEKACKDKAQAKDLEQNLAGETVCTGKQSCKDYIKNFLAAIPIRQLQADMKKGLKASTSLHHRLQIEFHYTQSLQPMNENFCKRNDSS